MPRIVFHVGMGKTGTTTIQAALEQSSPQLLAQGHLYLGRWLDVIGPEFDSYQGFQLFLRQSEADIINSANRFVNNITSICRERRINSIIFSNEQYLENIGKLAVFFNVVGQLFDLTAFVYVRSPSSWLPSAYIQWGVVHKTNLGPVQPFRIKARELMGQYKYIQRWHEVLGPKLIVRQFREDTDVVQDFSERLGVVISSGKQKYQKRPSHAESIMRAACNNLQPGIALPDVFRDIYSSKIPAGTPSSVTDKIEYLYNEFDLPAILSENSETMSYLEREFGLDLSTNERSGESATDRAKVSDDLLGMMVDLVFSQAHHIRGLAERIDKLERERARSAIGSP